MFGLFRRQNADVVVAHEQIEVMLSNLPESLAVFEQLANEIQPRVLLCPADYQAAVSGLFFAIRQCLMVEQDRRRSTGWRNGGRRALSYLFGGLEGVADTLETERATDANCDFIQQELMIPQMKRMISEYYYIAKKHL